MARRKRSRIPPLPRETDPVDLLDASYLEEDGIYEGETLLVDLKQERGLVAVPVEARVARKLYRAARRSGCTPSELASRCLARTLEHSTRR